MSRPTSVILKELFTSLHGNSPTDALLENSARGYYCLHRKLTSGLSTWRLSQKTDGGVLPKQLRQGIVSSRQSLNQICPSVGQVKGSIRRKCLMFSFGCCDFGNNWYCCVCELPTTALSLENYKCLRYRWSELQCSICFLCNFLPSILVLMLMSMCWLKCFYHLKTMLVSVLNASKTYCTSNQKIHFQFRALNVVWSERRKRTKNVYYRK